MQGFKEDGLDLLKYDEGKHLLDLEYGDNLFEPVEGSSVQGGSIRATLQMDRHDYIFRCLLRVSGEVKVTCDNCLETIPMKVENELEFVIRLTEVPQENDEDNEIYYVLLGEGKFYPASHVYDLTYLALPIRKVCEKPGKETWCNTEVLEKLNSINDDDTDDGDENDPRWDKLKDLL